MKITNKFVNALFRAYKLDKLQETALSIKNHNLLQRNCKRFFRQTELPVVIEQIQRINCKQKNARIMSEDDFMDLLPPNTYFH